MKNSIIVGFVILVIVFVTFGSKLLFTKDDNNKEKQNFLPGIQGVNTTYIQRSFNSLIELLNSFENKRPEFPIDSKTLKFIKATIGTKEKIGLDKLIKPIINKLNKSNLDFKVLTYNEVVITTSKDNKYKNYLIDVELWELKQYWQMRILVDTTIYTEPQLDTTMTCAQFSSLPFKTFPIGAPSLDQMIPLPTEVIPTGNIVLNNNGVKPFKPPIVIQQGIHSVKLVNSNEVIGGYNGIQNNNNRLMNIEVKTDSKTYDTPFVQKAVCRNKWPRLDEQPKGKLAWPCNPVCLKWNSNGIYNESKEFKDCYGDRSSYSAAPYVASYWPTLTTLPRNTGPNYWLFDITKNIPGLYSGKSVSGVAG